MLVENEDDRMSGQSGFYNRAALALDMKAIIKHNRNVDLIILRIKNLEIISRIVGGDETSLLSDILKEHGYPHQTLGTASKSFTKKQCPKANAKDLSKLRTRFNILSKIVNNIIIIEQHNLIDGIYY